VFRIRNTTKPKKSSPINKISSKLKKNMDGCQTARLIAAWNEHQAKRMPMLFSPTIGAAIKRAIGSCGSAARRTAPRMRSTYARSIVTATRQ
jgi:hypothetical protein